ncbi:AAA family ATPase [Treponema sp. UBA6852]|uniref:AAA family ATPase n=1 Tax=Treponema sp. UBA6852 TaxID=1947744 RepID=UPI0025CBBA0E|nr:AAA family ATPase [Treponema sp. UBA6852]
MAVAKTHDRIQKLIELIGNGLYEKDEAIRLGLLTALSGESMFMLGAPGCAKSMVTRRIKEAFAAEGEEKVKYFETLLNQFTTPEEVFGNISLKALNGELPETNGKEEYRRLTEGMLPEAGIAFLDEIWKASPAILNTLLTIINERKFHNGSKVMNVPLKGLFAASNELPAKNKGLEALYDRFIFRILVDFIHDENGFFEMISQPAADDFTVSEDDKKILVTSKELKEWAKEIDKVTLSEVSKNVISAIRKEMILQNEKMTEEDKKKGEEFEVGDRRWKKIAHILKTSAFLNDRDEVDLMDCSLIENCIWGTEKQQKLARGIVEKCIKENGISCDSAIEDIEEQIEEFKEKINDEWCELSPKVYQMSDGEKAYKIINPEEIYFADHRVSPAYISENFKWSGYTDRKGMLYDSNGNKLGPNSNFSFKMIEINEDEVKWIDWYRSDREFSFKIEMSKSDILKNFSEIAHYTLQKNFTDENYTPIFDAINEEINLLKEQKERDEIPFKANLFADQSYNESITSKIDDSIKALQDAQIELDKQKNRYFDSELDPELAVGDVVLDDGNIYSAAEIEELSEEQKEKVIGVVCIADEKNYVIGTKQYSCEWTKISDCCSKYSKSLPEKYKKNWLVPKIEILSKIWENRDAINKSLEAVNADLLEEREYWSYSENEDKSAARYFLFTKDGHEDHTTKDHDYAVRLIREWRNF